MNTMEDAMDRGFDPMEDYTPHPMSVERYREWCAAEGITPRADYGVFDSEPPF